MSSIGRRQIGRQASRQRSGFSLLEVMVALAILAMTLTALFAAEVGAFKAGHAAHRMTEGTLLARCKMAEIEADVAENGFQASLVTEENEPCCADEESDTYSCSWRIEPLELENLESDEIGEGSNPLGNLLGGGDEGGSSRPDADSVTGGATAEDILSGGSALSGGDMVTGLASEFVWPLIAPSIAAQVRRVIVTVQWGEDEGFDVAQYVVVEPGLGVSSSGLTGPQGNPGAPPLTPTPTVNR